MFIASVVTIVILFPYAAKAYEVGYNPSAEELDSLFKQRTWTADLTRAGHNFKPRYSYLGKYKKDYRESFYNPLAYAKPASEKIESKPGDRDLEASASVLSHSSADVKPQFPIFFSNPATGIVYAISEVGPNGSALPSQPNSSQVPIYIPKEQYEKDMLKLSKQLQSDCQTQKPVRRKPKPVAVNDNSAFNDQKQPINTVVRNGPLMQKANSTKSIFNGGAVRTQPLRKPGRIIKIAESKTDTKKSSQRVKRESDFRVTTLNPNRDKTATRNCSKSSDADSYYDYSDDCSEEKSNDYDYYDFDFDSTGIFEMFSGFFQPVNTMFEALAAKAGGYFQNDNDEQPAPTTDNRRPKYPHYIMYDKGHLEGAQQTPPAEGNGFMSFFGSWFNSDMKTPAPSTGASWFGYSEDQNGAESENWFFNWFSSKDKSGTTSPAALYKKNSQNDLAYQPVVNSSHQTDPDAPKKASYDKFQIWRLKLTNESQLQSVATAAFLQWLKGPLISDMSDVLVPFEYISELKDILSYQNIMHEVLMYDVGKTIDYEEERSHLVRKDWHHYMHYEEIIQFLETLQMQNPDIVDLIHVGRSYEGKPLVIAKLGTNKPSKKQRLKQNNKFGVFIEAGVHGREWISPASALWMANRVVQILKSNRTSAETEHIRNVTWYVMPVLNPDGYEYSQQFDRFWKKSRSKQIFQPNGFISSAMSWLNKDIEETVCYGVDLNRNWQSHGGKKDTPCNYNYEGTASLSEPETRALSKFLLQNRKNLKLYISLHSYGQKILYPTQIKSSLLNSEKLEDLYDVATVGTESLRRKNMESRYKVEPRDYMGSSNAYTLSELGIAFSYTLQLSDTGNHGYLLPAALIQPTAKHAFEIITAIIDYI